MGPFLKPHTFLVSNMLILLIVCLTSQQTGITKNYYTLF
jgi:hypothetical protein